MKNEDKTREQLIEELNLLNSVIEEMPDIFFVKDLEGRYLIMNQAGLDFGGWSSEQVIGHDDYAIFPKEMVGQFKEADKQTISDGITRTFEELVQTPTGPVTVITTKGVCRDRTGEIVGIFGIAKDISDRKKVESRLNQVKEYLDSILLNLPIGMAILEGPEFRYFRVNQKLAEFNGLPIESHLGKPLVEILPHSREKILPEMRQVIASGEAILHREFSVELPKTPGKLVHLIDWLIPIYGENREPAVVAVVLDVTELEETRLKLHKTIDSLKDAQHKAEAANTAKSIFLSRMSHELRTPLNAIIGFSEIQKVRYVDAPEGFLQCADEISSAGYHLLALVNDILDIVGAEQNRFSISLKSCDLNNKIQECITLVQQQADVNSITLESEVTPFRVIADDTRLKQILINLLTNAIKYNREGGSVTLQVREIEKDQVEICVQDTGVGIDPKDQHSIFEPFMRSRYATESSIAGVGIGLSLTKLLVEQMQGSIRFVSKMNSGTDFYITLPKAEVKASESQRALIQPVLSMKKLSVLYIEDDVSSALLIKMLFSALPNAVLQVAPTGEEGIELVKSSPFNLIIIDINLPGIDGISLLRKLKEYSHLQETIMIALSADALPFQIEKAIAAGFDMYLTKPIDIAQLINFVDII